MAANESSPKHLLGQAHTRQCQTPDRSALPTKSPGVGCSFPMILSKQKSQHPAASNWMGLMPARASPSRPLASAAPRGAWQPAPRLRCPCGAAFKRAGFKARGAKGAPRAAQGACFKLRSKGTSHEQSSNRPSQPASMPSHRTASQLFWQRSEPLGLTEMARAQPESSNIFAQRRGRSSFASRRPT